MIKYNVLERVAEKDGVEVQRMRVNINEEMDRLDYYLVMDGQMVGKIDYQDVNEYLEIAGAENGRAWM